MPTYALPPAPVVEIRPAEPKTLKTKVFKDKAQAEKLAKEVKGYVMNADGKYTVIWGEKID